MKINNGHGGKRPGAGRPRKARIIEQGMSASDVLASTPERDLRRLSPETLDEILKISRSDHLRVKAAKVILNLADREERGGR